MLKIKQELTLLVMLTSLFMSVATFGQGTDKEVIFHIKGAEGAKFYLVGFSGHDESQIDSAVVDEQGTLSYEMPGYLEPGIYRIVAGPNTGFEFIYNNEDVEIFTNAGFNLDSMRVEKSAENQLLMNYLAAKRKFVKKLSLLEPLVMYYPREDPFYSSIENQYITQNANYQAIMTQLMKESTGMVLHTFMKWDQLPDIDIGNLEPSMREYYKNHYFDQVSPEDTVMINTPVLPSRIIDYLSLYVVPGNSREQQEEAFVKGVDGLMAWSAKQKSMRDVIINFLIDGFQAYGFETVLTHLVENYVLDNSCVSDQEESKLRKRIEGFRTMAVGKTAPDFTLANDKGKEVTLSQLPGKLKLVVFWASWCPHCSEMIPAIRAIADQFEDQLTMVTISIDEDREAWKKALADKELDGINLCDFNGWDSQPVSEYYVYATPTMFLLDENLKIVAKPSNPMELLESLNEPEK